MFDIASNILYNMLQPHYNKFGYNTVDAWTPLPIYILPVYKTHYNSIWYNIDSA